MPDYFAKARTCVELCRFSYKMYAQTVKFPFDPFFEGDEKSTGGLTNVAQVTRKRMMAHIHDLLKTPHGDVRKFDPIQYRLDAPPNPSKSTVYRGETDSSYLIFGPSTWDDRIGAYAGFDTNGKDLNCQPDLVGSGRDCRCGYFQGETGMTANHPKSGWRSFLGAVIYDPTTQTAYIVFRGSRSGDGKRSLLGAQFFSEGNPDWVTDMNHVKETNPYNPQFQFGDTYDRSNVRLAGGFWRSYASSSKSMEAAFNYAVRGGSVASICVTGHSLGGALAQCAYIHLTTSPRIKTRLKLKENVFIECYPISAPPVCLGYSSQHWISRNANASNVHHYYCPKDAVHGCDLVIPSNESRAGWALAKGRHPETTPYHFGSQIALNCSQEFPNAHEPYFVMEAMCGPDYRMPDGFWPRVDFDLSTSTLVKDKKFPGSNSIGIDQIVPAITDSYIPADFHDRAEQWAAGITGKLFVSDNKKPAEDCIR